MVTVHKMTCYWGPYLWSTANNIHRKRKSAHFLLQLCTKNKKSNKFKNDFGEGVSEPIEFLFCSTRVAT